MNLTAGGRQRICVPDNYQKLVQQPLSTILIPLLSPIHMFDKSSTRPSAIEMWLSFDSFIYAQVRSAKHDRTNLCHHRSGHQGYSKGERHLEECYIMDPISSTTVPNFFKRHLWLMRVPGFLSVNVCSSNLDFCPLLSPRGPLNADLLR